MPDVRLPWRLLVLLTVMSGLDGCDPPTQDIVQGYVEGEFVYVASPLAGTLEALHVRRGDQVTVGAPLFTLGSTPERAAKEEAERRLAQGRASLEDAKKGKRPSEIRALEAQLREARAALLLAERDLARQLNLRREPGATAEQEFDRARFTRDQHRQRVAHLEAELKTAQLGSRADQIAAAEAHVRALEAALKKAEWDLAQKQQHAPQSGLVFDTLYREGEWVLAGRPVVVLLPPENVKVRAFVPEPWLASLRVGDTVGVHVDGEAVPLPGRLSFISPRAEYTPPVIFSRETREKLVYMVEATFEQSLAARLHPGQPVDLHLQADR